MFDFPMFHVLVYFAVGIIGFLLLLWIIGFRIIPNTNVCVVERWWSTKGSLKEQIIALNGESGFQPEVLRGGIHFLTPLMYKVHTCSLVTIPQGQIAYVFSRDGQPLEPTQTLGRCIPESKNFQDVRGFLENGGQKGPQRGIIREGTYAFNLAQFIVITESDIHYLPMGDKAERETITHMAELLRERGGFRPIVIKGSEDKVGIVTIHDGPSLGKDDIIAPTVGDIASNTTTYHNNFQDPEKFLKAGGFRGRQHQVLVEGTYFINRLFATVELISKTIIDVGFVGVVVSYIGNKGVDSTGDDYKHGELVETGCKGVWRQPLMPGKYAFNTYAGKVIIVPTTNIILKWISDETGQHSFDENLKEVNLITKDAFEPSLPLSVVLHIDYRKAPLVIQRFGNVKMLVEQTLDPMVSAYFKNIGQTKTLIELIQDRSSIQQIASTDMALKFAHYNLELEEVLIGTPNSGSKDGSKDGRIENILGQLRDRQIAREQIETFTEQERASAKQRELAETQAKAEKQKELTASSIKIEIESNEGKAQYHRSMQDAEKMKVLADAEATRKVTLAKAEASQIERTAEAEAKKIKLLAESKAQEEASVGIAKAMAIQEQVNAYGGPQYQVMQQIMQKFAEAVQASGIDIVPKTVVNMGGNGSNATANAFEALLGLLINEKLGVNLIDDNAPKNEDQKVQTIKNAILKSMEQNYKPDIAATVPTLEEAAPSAEDKQHS